MNVLGIIAGEMRTIGVPYEFMRWTGTVPDEYFIGEYSEFVGNSEDGARETTMIITGTTRGSWAVLEEYRERIRKHFSAVYGLRMPTDDGAVAIFYGNAFPVPTDEADLKRIQINLQIKEWRAI